MWKKGHITFLTHTDIEPVKLISILRQSQSNLTSKNDKKILESILNDFENKNFSFLTTQEKQYLERNPQENWAKYLIHRHKFNYYENSHVLPDFPLYLILEPVSACNLRCPFCWQIDEKFTSSKQMGMMELKLFKKIIDEAVSSGTEAITLTCRGEPTLHPQLGDMLEYCSGKFIEFKMNTNATKLNNKLIHQILKSGMTDLVFSVDSYYKEEFESLRVRAVFEEVVENIKKFKEIRDRDYPNSSCVTRASGVQVSEKQDPQKFEEFWKQYVDFVVMIRMMNRWDIYKNSTDVAGTSPCHYLGRSLCIYFDGSVIPCDYDYEAKLSLGKIDDSSIKKIWHNEKYKKMFDSHKNGKRNNYFPCDRCPVGT